MVQWWCLPRASVGVSCGWLPQRHSAGIKSRFVTPIKTEHTTTVLPQRGTCSLSLLPNLPLHVRIQISKIVKKVRKSILRHPFSLSIASFTPQHRFYSLLLLVVGFLYEFHNRAFHLRVQISKSLRKKKHPFESIYSTYALRNRVFFVVACSCFAAYILQPRIPLLYSDQ